MRIRDFSVPKQGNSECENDDSKDKVTDHVTLLRCAVADGATESIFSGAWAQLLTEAYVLGELGADNFDAAVEKLAAQWEAAARLKQLAWYALEKLSYGAFAALAGITLYHGDGSDESRCWNALTIGDSCLFQVRNGELLKALPLSSPDDFNNTPCLISSRQDRNKEIAGTLQCGNWEPGDQFFLLTDALACWFLKEYNDSRSPVQLSSIQTDQQFAQLIHSLRTSANGSERPFLKNDDSTMICIIAG